MHDAEMKKFPSPCGEIKGQNIFSSKLMCQGCTCFRPLAGKLRAKTWKHCPEMPSKLALFPSPCGEIKGQNDLSDSRLSQSAIVSVPLRGN